MDKADRKVAVIFPGIGYHSDKPLLYYSRKIAQKYGYEIINVNYGNISQSVKGSPQKMAEAFQQAMDQVTSFLSDEHLEQSRQLLFIGKSIGSAVASAFASKNSLEIQYICYTPIQETFQFVGSSGIVFHGTKDQWIQTDLVREECRRRKLPLYITEGANHSLETGDVQKDLGNLELIMRKTEEYIAAGSFLAG